MGHLQLSFFGAFLAVVDGQAIAHFRSAKIQALLVYLALRPQLHAREVLADLLWPDEPEAIAKKNLRQALYRLRLLLGDEPVEGQPVLQDQGEPFLLVTRATARLNPASGYRLDAADFRAALENDSLETAVSLYHGDLVPGFGCDSQPFEEWLRAEREHYHRQALDALATLTTHSLTRADFPAAERYARQQLRLESWREEAHRQLMQALALQGERSAALAQYETCQAILAAELGLEPTAETAALAQRIRALQIAPPAQREAERRFALPFVGRTAEFASLLAAYRRPVADGLRVVTLSGKAGMGKTRLAEQFATWAATQGADVLVGRSYETSAGLSYQPLVHLLRERIERENAPDDLLSDLWLSQLTRLLPELRERYPDLPPPTQEEATAKHHLFEAITRLVQALALRQPLVLVLEDWHWADSASRDVLQYAAVRWAEAKTSVMLVLTLRQEALDEAPDLQSWLARFQHAATTLPLALHELSLPELGQLIERLLAPGAAHATSQLTRFGDWLFAETEGQPLFLTETLKSLIADGLVRPSDDASAWQLNWAAFEAETQRANGRILPGVQQIIRGWLERITAAARRLLTAASVLAEGMTFARLCQIAALEQFEALTALDELLGKQLLLEAVSQAPPFKQEPLYRFSHQKVRAVVYAEASAARQRVLHQRACELLQTQAAPAAEIAHHALQAGLSAEAIRYSLRAGYEAQAQFATQVALAHYQTAWQLVTQSGWPASLSGEDVQALFTGLGRAYELIEAWNEAEDTYQAMIAHAQATGAPAMECQGLNHHAALYVTGGLFDPPHAISILQHAQRLAEQIGDRHGLVETALNLSRAARSMNDIKAAFAYGEQALALARDEEAPRLVASCLLNGAYLYAAHRQWETAEAYASEAQQQYEAIGNLVLAADAQRMAGGCQMQSGRVRESIATQERALAFAQQIENVWGQVEASRFLATAYAEFGQYGEALARAQQAFKLAHVVGPPLTTTTRSDLGIALRTTMALDAAQETLLALLGISTDGGFVSYFDLALSELCATYALAGAWAQACEYAQKVLQFHEAGSLLPMGRTSWYETEALLRGGAGDRARAEVARVAGIVGANRRYRLPLLRSQAVLAQWDGDAPQAIEHLEAALHLAQELELPGEAWPILGDLGKLYAERGDPAQAEQAHQEAVALIRRLANTIDDADLRAGFLAAEPVRSIVERQGLPPRHRVSSG